jgi:hypothetical protein
MVFFVKNAAVTEGITLPSSYDFIYKPPTKVKGFGDFRNLPQEIGEY